MEKKSISIFQVSAGDILAEDIIAENGNKLVAKDTTINDYIKDKLLKQGISKVQVYGLKEKDLGEEYCKVIYTVKEMLGDLSKGKALNKSLLEFISDYIFSAREEYLSLTAFLYRIQSFDEYTYTHSINTAFYSMLIASWIGLNEEGVKTVIKAGILHDVGKLHISESIINKQGKLTLEEFHVIKKHPVYGYSILCENDAANEDVRKAVLMHHERTDGSGYPLGVSHNDINVFAKIIGVADVYDAITSKRAYKKRETPFNAFQFFLTIGLGTFDVHILNTFIMNIASLYVGSKVRLSNGQIGEIVYVPPQDILYPIIAVGKDYLDLSHEKDLNIVDIL